MTPVALRWFRFWTFLALGFSSFAACSARRRLHSDEAEEDRVLRLPGWGEPSAEWDLFSGYISVDHQAGRALFYAYAEASLEAPDNAPLLLWLNGGPGCSSIGGGFFSELGPFYPTPPGYKLEANPYSWNKVAHVVFVDSPALVGWSYSLDKRDAEVGDGRTAEDLRIFLLRFLTRFPGLQDTPLYIAGESYAGHYLPMLAKEILRGNRKARSRCTEDGWLNFAGIAMGNGYTDAGMDNLGSVDYWWHHALISDQSARGMKENCNLSYVGPIDCESKLSPNLMAASSNGSDGKEAGPDNDSKDKLCLKYCRMARSEVGNINTYNIYADACTNPITEQVVRANLWARTGQEPPPRQGRKPSSGKRREAGLGRIPNFDPCVGDEVDVYMNLAEVQKALHANQTVKIKGPWEGCTRKIKYSLEDQGKSMLPVWKELLAAGSEFGLRFLVYSGDTDGIVPVSGTRRWVHQLGMRERISWRPWFGPPEDEEDQQYHQVGGYAIDYDLPSKEDDTAAGATSDGLDPGAGTAGAGAQQEVAVSAQPHLTGSISGSVITSRRSLLSERHSDANQSPAHQPQGMQEGAAAGKRKRGSFTFTTVRGAGHMVPYSQPARALHLIKRFLHCKDLD